MIFACYTTWYLLFYKKKSRKFLYHELKQFEDFAIFEKIIKNSSPKYLKSNSSRFLNYKLFTSFYSASDENDKIVFLSHGISKQGINMLRFSKFFIEHNYDLVYFDHRAHGNSGAKTITYGLYEKHDLETIINYYLSQKKYSKKVLLGESMGAVISLSYQSLALNQIDYLIADCPFVEFDKMVLRNIQKRLPFKFLYQKLSCDRLIFLFSRCLFFLFTKKNILAINLPDKIKNIKIPVLLIHGASDNFIPNFDSKKIYSIISKNNTKNKIVLFENSNHAESILKNYQQYYQLLEEFLDE